MSENSPQSFQKFLNIHETISKSDDLRIGQRFCNMYIKGSWPALYYADDKDAGWMIRSWLR